MGNAIDMNEMEAIARPLLPVFFVLDSSGSMSGQPISILNHAMEEVISILGRFAGSNSDALMKIGVLVFSNGAEWVQPLGLEEFDHFVYKPLKANGLTDMGAALAELNEKLSRKSFLVSTTGRCKPIIIFMTDGYPTDAWEEPLNTLKTRNKWYRNSIKIGFAVGDDADVQILSEIVCNTEAVIQTSDLETFSNLLQKVAINSAMIGSKSHVDGDSPNGGDIVKDTINETNEGENARTADDLGYEIADAIDYDYDDEDDWGEDWD